MLERCLAGQLYSAVYGQRQMKGGIRSYLGLVLHTYCDFKEKRKTRRAKAQAGEINAEALTPVEEISTFVPKTFVEVALHMCKSSDNNVLFSTSTN